MTVSQQVFHHVPKPITLIEFREALAAACQPRFPDVVQLVSRRIGLAVSGGADSMALAFLFSRLKSSTHNVLIADNLLLCKPAAFVIDHRLRPGSDLEAQSVVRQLNKLRHTRGFVGTVNWRSECNLPPDVHPSSLSNVESLARRLRYRRLGSMCRHMDIVSLFTAHHEDDQYETVLMRLLNGHGSRGLRGIMPANNIPECHGIHSISESGFVDDQLRRQPFYSFRPPRRHWRYVRSDLRSEIDPVSHMAELREGLQTELDMAYVENEYDHLHGNGGAGSSGKSKRRSPPIPPIPYEDAGIMVYRPLLGFGKDRLIATCEANNVPWVEDNTNHDPTLTTRNALRHMIAHHTLPKALQKPAILELSHKCASKTKAQEEEAERWLRKMTTLDFEANAGTLVAKLPNLAPAKPRRNSRYNARRKELRHRHRRAIAALLVRRLMTFVTPDQQLPLVSTLNTSVAQLFPYLAEPERPRREAKAFNQGSVLFIPISSPPSHPSRTSPSTSPSSSTPQQWFLARQPYPSNQSVPMITHATYTYRRDTMSFLDSPEQPPSPDIQWYRWRHWRLWDGRYWIRLRAKFKGAVRIAPFIPSMAKQFREGLDEKGRTALAEILRRYAPGKVRYTLPALYAVDYPPPVNTAVEADEADGRYEEWEDWEQEIKDRRSTVFTGRVVEADEGTPSRNTSEADSKGETSSLPEKGITRRPPSSPPPSVDFFRGRKRRIKLLALLTLPVNLPGLENWMEWEVRYKKVDGQLLEETMPALHGLGLGQGVESRAVKGPLRRVYNRRRWNRRARRAVQDNGPGIV